MSDEHATVGPTLADPAQKPTVPGDASKLTVIDFDHPPTDPVALFQRWMSDAEGTGLPNPNAMNLATVDADGRPSARIVLLKGFDAEGAVFFTNYAGRKGRALAANPMATLVFHWDVLDRQVVIEGDVTRTSAAASDAYFASRARPSRLGAWASRQSEPCADRAQLESAYFEIERRFGQEESDGPVPRPEFWGGFRVRFRSILFWQGHPFRLHDRVIYRPHKGELADANTTWTSQRLFP
ncbi:MAG: pyridoxamine 5'-phosphate oxidase [Myxococcota bacterium]